MNPQQANIEFVRGNVELVALSQVEGRIAAEGALPLSSRCFCAWFQGKSGAVLTLAIISWRWKKGSIYSGFSARLQRMYIKLRMMTQRNVFVFIKQPSEIKSVRVTGLK